MDGGKEESREVDLVERNGERVGRRENGNSRFLRRAGYGPDVGVGYSIRTYWSTKYSHTRIAAVSV